MNIPQQNLQFNLTMTENLNGEIRVQDLKYYMLALTTSCMSQSSLRYIQHEHQLKNT